MPVLPSEGTHIVHVRAHGARRTLALDPVVHNRLPAIPDEFSPVVSEALADDQPGGPQTHRG